jgi:hypothetical protein
MGGSIFIRKIFNESTPGMYSFLCKRIENRLTLIHISTYLEKVNYLETFSLFGPKKLIFALEGMPRKKTPTLLWSQDSFADRQNILQLTQ